MGVLKVLEDLIAIYQSKGDEQSLKRAEAEMEKVTTDTDGKGVFDLTYSESIVDERCRVPRRPARREGSKVKLVKRIRI